MYREWIGFSNYSPILSGLPGVVDERPGSSHRGLKIAGDSGNSIEDRAASTWTTGSVLPLRSGIGNAVPSAARKDLHHHSGKRPDA
jgi:hypothetical protein